MPKDVRQELKRELNRIDRVLSTIGRSAYRESRNVAAAKRGVERVAFRLAKLVKEEKPEGQ